MFHLPQVKFNPSESVSPCLIKIRKQLRMGLFSDLQNRLRNSGFWIFGALLMIYFAFHAINGDRGLLKYLYLRQEIAEAQKIAGNYNSQKLKLEEKVKHLSNSSLDLDLLEERARIVLNLAGQDEFIILDEAEN